jgi:ABC-type multidrug transport system ATPase subunit
VDSIDLKVRRGEILALLGHNGAGKSTLIDILMGLVEPTSATRCDIGGRSLMTQLQQVREVTSSCRQWDHLEEELNATQTLELVGGIRGMAPADAAQQASELIKRLDLSTEDKPVSEYSGGEKRRLSVACALMGDCAVILLDEPSAGVDPLNRHQMWSLLKEERDKGKCIVLSTHLMEEADYLGDRIAIMSYGRIVALDTSESLKAAYGVGYYLTVTKLTEAPEAFRAEALLAMCDKHCTGATISSQTPNECILTLPLDAIDRFGPLLQTLEDSLPQIGAESFGISINSLEDVFVTIAEQQEAARSKNPTQIDVEPMRDEDTDTSVNDVGRSVTAEFAAATEVPEMQRMRAQVRWFFHWCLSPYKPVVGVLCVLLGCAMVASGFSVKHMSSTPGSVDYATLPLPALRHLPVLKVPLVLPDPWYGTKYDGMPAQIDDTCVNTIMNYFGDTYNTRYAPASSPIGVNVFSEQSVKLGTWQHPDALISLSDNNGPVLLLHGCSPGSDSWRVNYTWFYPEGTFSYAPLYKLDFALRTAIVRWSTERDGQPWVDRGRVDFTALPLPTTLGVTAVAPGTSSSSAATTAVAYFTLLGVGICVAACASVRFNAKVIVLGPDMMPSADWCIRGIVLLCYIVPLLATFLACPFVADITAMRDPCFLSMTSIGLVLVALFLFLSVHALTFVLQGRGVVALITIPAYAGLCLVSPLPMLPGPYHALDFVFPPRAFAALIYMQDNFDAAAHCAWTYDSTALKAYMSLVCWCACCVVTILYQTHHDVLVRFFSTTASREQQPTVLPIDTDADVANEHERVSQLLAPAAPIPAADHNSSPTVVEATAVRFQPDHYIVRDLQKTYWKSWYSLFDAGWRRGQARRALAFLRREAGRMFRPPRSQRSREDDDDPTHAA